MPRAATASDWTKPNLRIHEVAGTLDNNVILADLHLVARKLLPVPRRSTRSPLRNNIKGARRHVPDAGLLGLRFGGWHPLVQAPDAPVFTDTDWVFDSQNVSFWSPAEERVVYCSAPAAAGRTGIRTMSPRRRRPDFISWSPPGSELLATPSPAAEPASVHEPDTSVFPRPHLYVGVAARFMPGRKVVNDDAGRRIVVPPSYFRDTPTRSC